MVHLSLTRYASIGFFGIGNMGKHMATNLIAANHQVTVFDINPQALDHFKEQKQVKIASVPQEAVANSEFIILMLPNEWKSGTNRCQVVAGGKGEGNKMDQLKCATDVVVDKETDSLIVCDRDNRRVMRWPRGKRKPETILTNIACYGLTMDDQKFLYVSDIENHSVKKYRLGETKGTIVAGGNGKGNGLNQLNLPIYLYVDRDQSVYISDTHNHRVMKWMKDAKEGIVVAGGRNQGDKPTQLSLPQGIFVDHLSTVYVADGGNHRVMRWHKGATQGDMIVGGNGAGAGPNQLNCPGGLSLDQHENIYVVDYNNHRVQRFSIEATN
ncbi:unnamed protein product [Rotaria sp. Silwood1]|nr:unnamed protein product [Rotaria sp. Silwood1]